MTLFFNVKTPPKQKPQPKRNLPLESNAREAWRSPVRQSASYSNHGGITRGAHHSGNKTIYHQNGKGIDQPRIMRVTVRI
jgi:hypothetical protein